MFGARGFRRRGRFGRSMGNPVITNYLSRDLASTGTADVASFKGIFVKTLTMLLLTALAFFIVVHRAHSAGLTPTMGFGAIFAIIAGIIIVVVAYRNPAIAVFLGPAYALLQGYVMASAYGMLITYGYQDILLFALVSTLGIFFTMLLVYRLNIIRVNHKFRSFVLAGLLFVLIMTLLFSLLVATGVLGETVLGVDILLIALVIAIISVVYGALTLMVDFQAIDDMVNARADKTYEWILSLSLVISLIYIYYQMVRIGIILLARSQRKR